MSLPMLPQDSANHWVYGSVGAAVTLAALRWYGTIVVSAVIATLLLSLAVAVGKKMIDYYVLHLPYERKDFMLDVGAQMGGAVVAVLCAGY